MSTFLLFAYLLFLLLLYVACWGTLLKIGLKWTQAKNVSWKKIGWATLIVFFLQLPLELATQQLPAAVSLTRIIAVSISMIAIWFVLPSVVIGRVFQIKIVRAFGAWLPTLLAFVLPTIFVLTVARPFLMESYMISSNAMAPTIIGPTHRDYCKVCGAVCYSSPAQLNQWTNQKQNPPSICENFHTNHSESVSKKVYQPDRVLVSKTIQPKRWDLVVFRYPGDLNRVYIMRLIGLPGEKITIKTGSVFANGTQLEIPDTLQGIQYLDRMPGAPELWGTQNNPAILGPDEYFVLGDFSIRSSDSRLWPTDATGRSPFAVPKNLVIGVATHTFWPLDRWKIHR